MVIRTSNESIESNFALKSNSVVTLLLLNDQGRRNDTELAQLVMWLKTGGVNAGSVSHGLCEDRGNVSFSLSVK